MWQSNEFYMIVTELRRDVNHPTYKFKYFELRELACFHAVVHAVSAEYYREVAGSRTRMTFS